MKLPLVIGEEPRRADLNSRVFHKQLLKDAGYPSAFTDTKIKCYAAAGGGNEVIQLLQGYWAAAGIKVDLEVVDSVQWMGMVLVRNVDPTAPNVGNVLPWYSSSVPNSVYAAANMYTSNGIHSTGNDLKADELYRKVITELDPAKARQYYTEFREYVEGLYYNVGILIFEPFKLVGPKLGEFTTNTYRDLGEAYAGIQHP